METAVLTDSIETETPLVPQEKAPPPIRRRLSDALRVCGAAILLSAGMSFLAQGFGGWTSIERIAAFLAFILSICGAGYLCGIKLRDPRSARVAVGIAALMIPVLMSQLGGLIFSRFAPPPGIPSFFVYQATSALEASGAAVITLAAAIAVAFFSFSVLARTAAASLTTLFVAVNIALLIPSRAPETIALLTFMAIVGIIWHDYRSLRGHAELRTAEGRYARLLPLVPVVLLVGRSLVLYGADNLIASALSAVIGGVLFFLVAPSITHAGGRDFTRGTGVTALMLAWINLVAGVFTPLPLCSGGICLEWINYRAIQLFPLAAITFILAEFSASGGRGYRRLGGVITLLATLLTTPEVFARSLSLTGLTWALVAIASGLVAIVVGITKRERTPLIAGTATLGTALLTHIAIAVTTYSISPWILLSVLGLAILVGSSYIEHSFETIVHRVRLVSRRFESRSCPLEKV